MPKMFEQISIMGRVAFCITCLERYLSEKGRRNDFEIVFRQLWSFREMEFMDDYAYKIIELKPDVILAPNADFEENEFISVDESDSIKAIYQTLSEEELHIIGYLLEKIDAVLWCHLYTSVTAPAQKSLTIIEEEVYPFMLKTLVDCPKAEDFCNYIMDKGECWGICGF